MGVVAIEQKLGCLCFLVILCTMTFWMGFMWLQISQLGGMPFFIALVPFGMGFLGILGFISQIRSWRNPSPPQVLYQSESWTGDPPPRTSYQSEPLGYTGDYVVDVKSHKPKPVYRLPPQCPSCNADISSEDVGWVGPLQARCPYCFKTIDLDEHYK